MRQLLTVALTALVLFCGAAALATESDEQAAPLGISEVAAMPAGSWLQFGRPWRDIDPGRAANCNVDFGSVLGAWNGVLWDGRYVWSWAAGGHGDGCFNGIIRYDLQAGKPEMVVPHLALNVPLCWTFSDGAGCWNEPYVSATPWPGGMGLTQQQRLGPDGPNIPAGDYRQEASRFGAFLRPRSSHMYNNLVKIGDYIYLLTGQTYGGTKSDSQVWRFNVNDPANTIERMPDRWDPNGKGGQGDSYGGYNVSIVQRPGLPPLMFSGGSVFEIDLAAGTYTPQPDNIVLSVANSTAVWDDERQGVWVIDSQYAKLRFAHLVNGKWVWDASLEVSDPRLDKNVIGSAGVCIVPTPNGTNPVIWGKDATLLRWDGRQLHRIKLPGGPPEARRNIFNKWTWNADLGVCLGTWTVDEGLWAFKPDFIAGGESSAAGARAPESIAPESIAPESTAPESTGPESTGPESTGPKTAAAKRTEVNSGPPSLPPAPTPNPALANNPLLPREPANQTKHGAASEGAAAAKAAAPAGDDEEESDDEDDSADGPPAAGQVEAPVNLKKVWWTDPADYPTFDGHRVAPAPWKPAAWNEPIERQPEAPDYDALCPGPWAELNYTKEEDLANSAAQMRDIVRGGTPNIRVYLHPRTDDSGEVVAYTDSIKFDEVRCSEIVGVPLNGEKPQTTGAVAASGVGIIARGIMFKGDSVRWKGNRATNTYPAFVVLQDLDIYSAGHLMGDSPPKAPLTYLEFRGNVIGNNTDWHVIYLERSIGKLVALSNIFYGSGRTKHAFKNLAHQSRIEGNVFSNVGIDGQVLRKDRKGREVVGLMPLDLYLCTETVFRNNTVLFRTSGAVRSFMNYRGRRAWGNCDKGRRLDNGRWELWPPESPDYQNPEKWAEIHKAVAAFDKGYEAAKAEPWLFTHKVEGNTFIAFDALMRDGKAVDDVSAAHVVSIRPVADNHIRKRLNDESRSLSKQCAGAADAAGCMLAEMSPGLRYVYDHVSPGYQHTMVANGDMPRGVPIPPPAAWEERSGIFWGPNDFITCSGDGRDCRKAAPRPVDAEPKPWDELEIAHPPRIIPTH